MKKRLLYFLILVVGISIPLGYTFKSNKKITYQQLVYNWGVSKNKNDPKQVEKILKIIGDVNFSKLWELEVKNNKVINFYKSFYDYPHHNFQTIKNLFNAKTDGAYSEEFDAVIFDLYKKNNVRPIIQAVIKSNSKYKERFKSILKFESP